MKYLTIIALIAFSTVLLAVDVDLSDVKLPSKSAAAMKKFDDSMWKETQQYLKKVQQIKEKCLKTLRQDVNKQKDVMVALKVKEQIEILTFLVPKDVMGKDIELKIDAKVTKQDTNAKLRFSQQKNLGRNGIATSSSHHEENKPKNMVDSDRNNQCMLRGSDGWFNISYKNIVARYIVIFNTPTESECDLDIRINELKSSDIIIKNLKVGNIAIIDLKRNMLIKNIKIQSVSRKWGGLASVELYR